jgi:hypothetical protein
MDPLVQFRHALHAILNWRTQNSRPRWCSVRMRLRLSVGDGERLRPALRDDHAAVA